MARKRNWIQEERRKTLGDYTCFCLACGSVWRYFLEGEAELPAALEHAMAAAHPFVIDVRIDPTRRAPSQGRNRGLRAQLAMSFPTTS